MMQLVIDIGNTQGKMAVFQGDAFLAKKFFLHRDLLEVFNFMLETYDINSCIVSATGDVSPDDLMYIKDKINTTVLTHHTKVPFVNKYATPQTLGKDRIALVAAFAKAYPNENGLIIDAGTCITYDFITENAEYLGGSISLGLSLRYKALHEHTASLPELSPVTEATLIGNHTVAAMHSGVLLGTCAEIDGIVDAYKLQYDALKVIITGGDGDVLSKRLKNSIFAHSNFLLEGLNYILTIKDD